MTKKDLVRHVIKDGKDFIFFGDDEEILPPEIFVHKLNTAALAFAKEEVEKREEELLGTLRRYMWKDSWAADDDKITHPIGRAISLLQAVKETVDAARADGAREMLSIILKDIADWMEGQGQPGYAEEIRCMTSRFTSYQSPGGNVKP